MQRRVRQIDYVQRILDLIIVFISWLCAYCIRFELKLGGDSSSGLLFWYLNLGVLLGLVSIVTFRNLKLYDIAKFESMPKELAMQVKANAAAIVIFLVLVFFVSEYRISRIVLFLYFAISSIALFSSRIFFRNKIKKRGINLVLVGNGEMIKKFYENVGQMQHVRILYWVDPLENLPPHIPVKNELNYDELESSILDGLVIGYDQVKSLELTNLLKKISDFIVPIIVLPDVSCSRVGCTVGEFKGQPLIYLNEPNPNQVGLILKRLFDIVAVLMGGLLISPLLFLLAILVKVTSPGPVFYGQVRMGIDGRRFKMWKFRSMVDGKSNHQGWTVPNDPRVTRVGRIMRKTGLDELPQLWNVLVGEMSLVGPRPERPKYVKKFREEIPGYMIRHKHKAGITGWAQVNGWRGDTSIERRIECDLWYVKNWSIWLDFSILFMTFFKAKARNNAY